METTQPGTDRPLRVAFTLEQCWHDVPGGIAQAALDLGEELDRRPGLEMIGVAAHHAAEPAPRWAPTIETKHLALPRRLLYESWHYLRKPSVERATGPVDVIHATGLAIPPRTAPLVVTAHDLVFVHYPWMFSRNARRFFNRSIELTKREADLVLCVSQSTRDDYANYGFDPDKLRIVPHGVSTREVSAADVGAVEAKHGLTKPYILWTGTVEPRKNLAGLVAAYEALGRDDVDLVLVGGSGWQVDLAEIIDGLGDRVKPLGFLPSYERDALYAGCAVFCMPSLLEGFGLPVLEAMAQGAAVVTSAGTSTEALVKGVGTAVDPTDPQAIADAIAAILDDPDGAPARAAAGKERAAEYEWADSAALAEAAYREAVANAS